MQIRRDIKSSLTISRASLGRWDLFLTFMCWGICWVCAYLVFNHFAWQLDYWERPYWLDRFVQFVWISDAVKNNEIIKYFFTTWNYHIVFIPRIVFFIDDFIHGNGNVPVVINNIILITIGISLMYRIYKVNIKSAASKWAIMFMGLLLINNSAAIFNIIWDFQIQHQILIGCFWAVIMLLPKTEERPIASLAAITILAWLAILSIGGGILVLVLALMWKLIFTRWNYQTLRIIAYLLVNVIIAIAITSWLIPPKLLEQQNASVVPFARSITYYLLYAGSSFVNDLTWPAYYHTIPRLTNLWIAVGGVLTLIALYLFYICIRNRERTPSLIRIAAAISGLAIGIGVLLTYTRVQLDAAAARRYVTYSIFLWIAFLLAVTHWSNGWSGLRQKLASCLMGAVVLPLVAYAQINEQQVMGKYISTLWRPTFAMLYEVNDYETLRNYNIRWFTKLRIAKEYMERNKLGIFGDVPDEYRHGMKLSKTTADNCLGEVNSIQHRQEKPEVFDNTDKAYQIYGWSWDPKKNSAPKYLIFLNDENIIIGGARVSVLSPAADKALGQKLDELTGWIGYARTPIVPLTVRILGFDKHWHLSCALTMPINLPAP